MSRYIMQKRTTNFIDWRCTKRMNACTTRLKIYLDLLEPEIVGAHNHEPSQIDNISRAHLEMKNTALNNIDNPALCDLVIEGDGEWGTTCELTQSTFLSGSRIIAFGKDAHMVLNSWWGDMLNSQTA